MYISYGVLRFLQYGSLLFYVWKLKKRETNSFLYFSQTPSKSKCLISHSHISRPVDPKFGRSMTQPSRYQTNGALLKLLHQIANCKYTSGCTINKADP